MRAKQPPSKRPRGRTALRGAIAAVLLAALLAAPVAAQEGPPPNVAVSPATPPNAGYQSPHLAVDPTNRNRLALAYYEWNIAARECRLARASDRGASWSDAVIVGDGGQIPLPAGESCLHARVAYGPDGTLYYMYTETQASSFFAPWSIWVATSRDGGQTFDAPVRLADKNALRIIHAQTAITVDQASARVYAAWANADPNRFVLLVSSTNRGQSFSTPVRVDPPDQTLTDEPGLVVEPGGKLYVSWRRFVASGANTDVFVRSSTDQGATFGPASLALHGDPGCFPCTRPSEYAASNATHAIAGGKSPGELFVVGWRPEGGTDSSRRIVFSASRDGGATWTPERIVGIPPGGESRDQVRPWISVTPGGRIEVVYYDMETQSGALQDVYEIHSDDGGATFSAPRRLNDIPSSTSGGTSFVPGTAQLGARLGVASSADSVFAAWTDTRRGDATNRKQDVFFTRIPLPVPVPPTRPEPPSSAQPSAPFAGCPTLTANVIRGSAASNSIVGTPRADRILADAGNDTVDALAGDDCVDLGPGADRGEGGPGADLILGGLGEDRLAGSAGNDRLRGGASGDGLLGGAGNDSLQGESGSDKITGNSGRDRISGGSGRDRLTGGSGRDRISGASGNDRIDAQDGRGGDRITCGSGRDSVAADRGDRIARSCERVRRRRTR